MSADSHQTATIERPKSLTVIATQRLRDLIVDGSIELGALISEKQIADMFGISKTPVREAFAQLQAVGLMEVVPQKGGIVFRPDINQVRELCEVRLELESAALRLAMERNRDGLIDFLSDVVRRMDEVFDTAHSVPYQRLDSEFHSGFFRFCGNTLLAAAYDSFNPRIRALRTHLTAPQAFLLTRSKDEHRILVDYLRQSDLASALLLLNEHIHRTRDLWSALLARTAGR